MAQSRNMTVRRKAGAGQPFQLSPKVIPAREVDQAGMNFLQQLLTALGGNANG